MQRQAKRPCFMRVQEVVERLGPQGDRLRDHPQGEPGDVAKGAFAMKERMRSDIFERVFFPEVGEDARS
ncbi:hypothetical protein [Bifidobacterium moukalabense]|uniref:Uncharacterized protein n=1 Tax=Bifidobacterium moukalabense DSM 27321 TaxID=1435051 RepID=W4N9U1_9BIFI|nr:hypothetical protein [Bifidobacterium moukalabense]ETY71415.1 hypothetical protein BMOU_0905 [Bifidobacterium moukalabense DSM 27321]